MEKSNQNELSLLGKFVNSTSMEELVVNGKVAIAIAVICAIHILIAAIFSKPEFLFASGIGLMCSYFLCTFCFNVRNRICKYIFYPIGTFVMFLAVIGKSFCLLPYFGIYVIYFFVYIISFDCYKEKKPGNEIPNTP